MVEDDMAEQLAPISSPKNYSRKELIKQDEAYDLSGFENWKEATKDYLEDLKIGVDAIHNLPYIELASVEVGLNLLQFRGG